MPYVMVPVPEEHVSAVLALVLRLSEGGDEPLMEWDQEALSGFVAETGEPARAILAFLADPARADTEVGTREVARALGVERAELSGILGPLNRRCRKAGRVPLFERRVHSVVSPRGRAVKHRFLVMPEKTAEMVRAALFDASGTTR
jgi:hypothetical protein